MTSSAEAPDLMFSPVARVMISCALTIALFPPMSKLFSWVSGPGGG